MATSGRTPPPAQSLATIARVVLCAAIVAAMHVGRELFVPLALAALLTFLLSPLVRRLQRPLGRVMAVACAVGLLLPQN